MLTSTELQHELHLRFDRGENKKTLPSLFDGKNQYSWKKLLRSTRTGYAKWNIPTQTALFERELQHEVSDELNIFVCH